MPASARAPPSAARTRLIAQPFGTADIAKHLATDLAEDLAKTKIRAAKAECTMATTFGPVCGGSPFTMARTGPRGEDHAVAVFCVEGPLRGRGLARAAATDMGFGPIPDIEFRKSGRPDR